MIASVCILAYLGAIVFVIVNIHANMNRRSEDAYAEFSALAGRAMAAGAAGALDEAFAAAVQEAMNRKTILEGAIVYGPAGVLGFERERGSALLWGADGSPRFRSRFGLSRWHMPLRIPGMWNVNIEAASGMLDFAELSAALKQAMILIAAALALAFFTLLAESSAQRRRAPAHEPGGGADGGGWEEEPAGGRSAAAGRDAEGGADGGANASGAQRQRPKPAPRRPGSYTERGQVVAAEHAEARLAEEIERSASAGQDVAFIAIEFKPAEASGCYARLASDAARFFASREFICERGERGLSVICPGLTLDMGFLNASEFHSRIMGKYPDVFKHKTDLCMGISARSDREPISAARLVFEAEEALERALMDPVSHVIAFKVDPDKYRAFMEGRRTADG